MDQNVPTVLIVDDEEGVRNHLELRLKKLGLNVLTAVDGLKAVDKVHEVIPDLIILDLFLPRLSGEEVCKQIRENDNEQISAIPIIMVTAKDSQVDKIVGKVIGANAYLTKPFEFQDVLEEIKKFIQVD